MPDTHTFRPGVRAPALAAVAADTADPAMAAGTVYTDTIAEVTSGAGVTIDGLLIKDGTIKVSNGGELTIATGAITVTGGYHTVDTEADAASDDLDTITGLAVGETVTLSAANGARTVVLKHGVDNIYCPNGQDVALGELYDAVTVFGTASYAIVVGKSIRTPSAIPTGSYFTSTEQTGTGAAQNVAHGLGATPSMVWWSISDAAAGLTAGPPPVLSIAPGAHDATNCVFTVSTGVKFYVHALK